ncbi:hypothetical protein C8R42DRAFT_716562 [Lentinula raphanica]|nr:hypothetical protein C8R42DRAFT_716562 [Lentinula raphanica]
MGSFVSSSSSPIVVHILDTMASSSKGSASKRPSAKPVGNRVYGVTPAAPPSASSFNDPADGPSQVSFDASLRILGVTPMDKKALFLPASAEECSVLVNNFRRSPNSKPPAFHLPQYADPDKVQFKTILDTIDNSPGPATFYPPQLITTCELFSKGRLSTGQGLHLYQALVILQRAFAKIMGDTIPNRRIVAASCSLWLSPTLSIVWYVPAFYWVVSVQPASTLQEYYHLYWHYTSNCPLFAPILIALICDFCADHLTPEEYAAKIYDGKARDGYGMSSKTRQRVKDYLPEPISLKQLAIPIPFDATTREGQIIVTIASQGTDVDQIRQPRTNIALRPDPSSRIVAPKPSKARSGHKEPFPPPSQRRPSSPKGDESSSEASSRHGVSAPSSPQRFPLSRSPVPEVLVVEDEDDDEPDLFVQPPDPIPPITRRSIARAAKTKHLTGDAVVKASTPSVKRERDPVVAEADQPANEPPSKKRRTQSAAGVIPSSLPIAPPDPPRLLPVKAPVRIQEGPPDYFDDDDTKTTGHEGFLTNPDFQPKAPFSQLIRKTVAQNPRAPKLPFLRAPKWQISDEMKNFGAFINSADTSFSLQGLSRYNYLASRHLQSTTSTTLPSPDALYSPTNCLTCLTRGVVCDGGSKLAGACSHCDRTHRSCSNSLGLEDHKDRFLAIHNTIQGYPAGYSGSLDRFRATLEEMGHVTASFETIFKDVRRRLSHQLQEIRANGFDFNVVLSQWVDDNPNHPLDYDLLTWLATFFGWDSACNLSSFLVDPDDTARLEEFLRNNISTVEVAEDPSTSSYAAAVPTVSPSSPVNSTSNLPAPLPSSRRRPSAAIPINFTSDLPFHTPPASTTVDEEMDVEEGTSRASVVHALVTEYDDSDDEEDAEVETDDDVPVEIAPPASLNISKSRK